MEVLGHEIAAENSFTGKVVVCARCHAVNCIENDDVIRVGSVPSGEEDRLGRPIRFQFTSVKCKVCGADIILDQSEPYAPGLSECGLLKEGAL